MSSSDFRWPESRYDHEFGLRLADLQSVPICDELCEHAVEFAGWPGGLDGRIQFHALVLYCLRVGKPPGRLLTSAVREQRFGRMAWSSAAERVEAARRIGASSRDSRMQREAVASVKDSPAVARDWSEIDSTIDQLTEDEALELLPNQFTRDLFLRAAANGQSPKGLPTMRHVLRRAVESSGRGRRHLGEKRMSQVAARLWSGCGQESGGDH